jgi:uncharacterized protein YcbK (DUF882 family)
MLLCGSAALAPPPAVADRTHTVRAGQSLARIARRYGIRVQDLAAANGIGTDAQVRPGQVLRIPDEGVVYVRSGQTLAAIARANDVSVGALARENRLREDAALRVGQRLVLPGHAASAEAVEAADRWGRPRSPGVVDFMRVHDRERARLRILDRRGRASSRTLERVAQLMRPAGTRRAGSRPDARLVELLARVSDHFGGRTIYVLSGFRHAGGYTAESSRHVSGHALDFRVRGVPNTEVRDFCRTLDDVGVGYYPRSTFVHLDTRERSAYWVDWSRPGEAPEYRDPSEGPPPGEAGDVGAGAEDRDAPAPEAATGTE